MKLFHPTFAAAAFEVFGGNALIGIVTFSVIWSRRANRGGRDIVKEIIQNSWPLFFSSALVAIMNAADRYQLQWWLGPRCRGFVQRGLDSTTSRWWQTYAHSSSSMLKK